MNINEFRVVNSVKLDPFKIIVALKVTRTHLMGLSFVIQVLLTP